MVTCNKYLDLLFTKAENMVIDQGLVIEYGLDECIMHIILESISLTLEEFVVLYDPCDETIFEMKDIEIQSFPNSRVKRIDYNIVNRTSCSLVDMLKGMKPSLMKMCGDSKTVNNLYVLLNHPKYRRNSAELLYGIYFTVVNVGNLARQFVQLLSLIEIASSIKGTGAPESMPKSTLNLMLNMFVQNTVVDIIKGMDLPYITDDFHCSITTQVKTDCVYVKYNEFYINIPSIT